MNKVWLVMREISSTSDGFLVVSDILAIFSKQEDACKFLVKTSDLNRTTKPVCGVYNQFGEIRRVYEESNRKIIYSISERKVDMEEV